MTKFSDRIKKSAKTSPIILANDYDPKTPNIESKTLKNIKLLSDYLCGIKINFHLLLQLDKKQISKDMIGIHLWNEVWRKKRFKKDRTYHKDSLYEQLKLKHNIK